MAASFYPSADFKWQPVPPFENIQSMYDAWGGVHYERYVENEGEMKSNQVVLDLILRYWPHDQENNLTRWNFLDVGCGSGLIGKRMFDRLGLERSSVTMRGFDLSSTMAASAKEFYGPDNVCLHNGDITPWPVPSDWANVTICNGVIIYLTNAKAILHEFTRVAAPGGIIILMVRHDAPAVWKEGLDTLTADGLLQELEITPSQDNFPKQTATGLPPALFNVFVYRKQRPTSNSS